MHFSLLRREKKYHGKIIDLTIDHLQYPSGNKTIREIIEHPGGAVVVALFDNNDILLVEQYRHPFGKTVIELPAGKLDKDEDPLLCAKRELTEETGYASDHWNSIMPIMTTPGFCNEVLHLFLADKIYLSTKGQALEEGESSIKILRVPLVKAVELIESHKITDAKTIIGIMLTVKMKNIL